MLRTRIISYILPLIAISLSGCGHSGQPATTSQAKEVQTPVTITRISCEPLTEYIEVNAVSAFLTKSYIKANANGYLQSVAISPGERVSKGQILFTVKTKEAQSLGNLGNSLDSTFHFSGVNPIKAAGGGYITQLDHQNGDYVQDGEQLAIISDLNSFVFQMELPYELRSYLKNQKKVYLFLPDGRKIQGTISSAMPTVDPVSQTQRIIVKVGQEGLPENLIAKVRIIKATKNDAISLPKSAVLSNETQSEFWIMKMTDDATAIKVPIEKGIETADKVEVISPILSKDDRILLTGNYGLADTARVVIRNPDLK